MSETDTIKAYHLRQDVLETYLKSLFAEDQVKIKVCNPELCPE
jgi:hypothetical protein